MESSQFNFSQQQLAYIAPTTISIWIMRSAVGLGGASYSWHDTRLSADMIFGTGLRQDLVLADGFNIPNGDHTPSYVQVNLGASHAFRFNDSGALRVRFDVINLFDKVYEIRSGTGIGVFAPQYGARRGLFAGVSKDL